MSSFKYLQALAHTIHQTRFKTIEVFDESNSEFNTKTFQLYRLALDPAMTSILARERLLTSSSNGIRSVAAFNRLLHRTINRLENLVFFVDPVRFSDEPVVVQQVSAVRSLVVGLYLSQLSVTDGAVFHIQKGLRSISIIPAASQGYCVAALRYMLFHVSAYGPKHRAKEYHEQLQKTTDALHLETTLRAQHDLLYAQLYTGSIITMHVRLQWDELYQDCMDALTKCAMPWFVESISRIVVSCLQATERYQELIKQLRSSPLPKREVLLQTAICYMAQSNVNKAADKALRARDLFAQGTRNWFVATDIATRALLLQAKTETASIILREKRAFPSVLANDSHLIIGHKLIEAYCLSLENLRHGGGPRRGRPPELVRSMLETIRSGSLARHYFIAAQVWVLIESMAQRNQIQYDETLVTLWRFLQRRKQLRDNSRLSVFVNYLYKHRNQPPTNAAQREYRQQLAELPGAFTDSELVRYEILGDLLVGHSVRSSRQVQHLRT